MYMDEERLIREVKREEKMKTDTEMDRKEILKFIETGIWQGENVLAAETNNTALETQQRTGRGRVLIDRNTITSCTGGKV